MDMQKYMQHNIDTKEAGKTGAVCAHKLPGTPTAHPGPCRHALPYPTLADSCAGTWLGRGGRRAHHQKGRWKVSGR